MEATAESPGTNPLFAVWQLVRVIDPLIDDAVAGMSAADFGLYSQLRYSEPVTISALAEELGSPLSTVSQYVGRLEDRGHVALVPNPADGRSRLVSLTPTGVRAQAEAAPGFQALLARVRSVLGADEPAVLAALERLRDALQRVRRDEDLAQPDDAPTVPGPLSLEQRAEVERFTAWVRWRDGAVS